MALPLWLVVPMDGRCSQRSRPSPTLGSLGPSHQCWHRFQLSVWGYPCDHGLSGTPYGAMRNIWCGAKFTKTTVWSSIMVSIFVHWTWNVSKNISKSFEYKSHKTFAMIMTCVLKKWHCLTFKEIKMSKTICVWSKKCMWISSMWSADDDFTYFLF